MNAREVAVLQNWWENIKQILKLQQEAHLGQI